ncbi:hypothetical protein CHS0354_028633 [Potamilus streckersoni]|uniref:Uncharacterized protein n=1 Tax=Potamilus streckersoni TaxID=2493646 RepID=A0AAE0W247_9BIVA|nr:hypothetical protein CHS0354_028633 [Potamilus streckersoni]
MYRDQQEINIRTLMADHTDLDDGTIEQKWELVRDTFTSRCVEVLRFRRQKLKNWIPEDAINKSEHGRSRNLCMQRPEHISNVIEMNKIQKI